MEPINEEPGNIEASVASLIDGGDQFNIEDEKEEP